MTLSPCRYSIKDLEMVSLWSEDVNRARVRALCVHHNRHPDPKSDTYAALRNTGINRMHSTQARLKLSRERYQLHAPGSMQVF
jgi:hypothetical protein